MHLFYNIGDEKAAMIKRKNLKKIIVIAIFLIVALASCWTFKNRETQCQNKSKNLKTDHLNNASRFDLDENSINIKDSIEEPGEEENNDEGEEGESENQDEEDKAKSEDVNNTVTSLLLIGSAVVIAAYSIRLIKKKRAAKYISLEREKGLFKDGQKITESSQSCTQIFKEENAIDKLSKLGDINVTILPSDFLEKVESIKWDENEKEEFIREMISLTPSERDMILKKMIQIPN